MGDCVKIMTHDCNRQRIQRTLVGMQVLSQSLPSHWEILGTYVLTCTFGCDDFSTCKEVLDFSSQVKHSSPPHTAVLCCPCLICRMKCAVHPGSVSIALQNCMFLRSRLWGSVARRPHQPACKTCPTPVFRGTRENSPSPSQKDWLTGVISWKTK